MADRTTKVVLTILGDSSKAKKALRDLRDEAKGTDEKLQSLGKAVDRRFSGAGRALSAFGAAGIAAFGMAANAAADEEREMVVLEQTLKNVTGATEDQTKAVEDWVTKTQNATGIADGKLRPALAHLVTATKDVGKAQELMGVAMDISVARGLDLETVTLAMSKAQNGNLAGLQRLGIATKDAEGKTLSFDEVMKNAAKTFGGSAAKAAETNAGKMEIMRAKFADLTEQVGTAVLPIMAKLTDVATKLIAKFTAMPAWVQNVAIALVAVAAVVGPLLMVIGPLISTIGTLIGAFTAASGAIAAAGGVMAVLTGPVGIAIAAIALLIAAGILLYKNWDKVVAAAKAAVKWIRQTWEGLPGPIKTALAPIKAYIETPFKVGLELVKTAVKLGKAVISGDFNAIPGILSNALKNVVSIIAGPFERAYNAIKGWLGKAKDFVSSFNPFGGKGGGGGDIDAKGLLQLLGMGSYRPGSTKGGMASTTQGIWNMVQSSFPGSKFMGGYNYRLIAGTNKLSDHATGHAFDVGGSAGTMSGIAQFLATQFGRLPLKYLIYNRQINSGGGWRQYNGANPHTDHVHVSTYHKGGLVPGRGNVPAILEGGEYVLSRKDVAAAKSLGGGVTIHIGQVVTNDPRDFVRGLNRELKGYNLRLAT